MRKSVSWVVVAIGLLFAGALLARGCPENARPAARRPLPDPPMPEPVPEPRLLPAPLVIATVIPEPVLTVRPPPPQPAPAPPPAAVTPGWAYGVVRLLGSPPPREKIRRGDKIVLSDKLVVDKENHVKWAFVHVVQGPTEEPPEVPEETVELDLRDSTFAPHVLGIRAGQNFVIRNHEERRHRLRCRSVRNWESARYLESYSSKPSPVRFEREEVMIRVTCSRHRHEGAWIGVLEHPHFSVTGSHGFWFIGDLLPGPYKIEAWHEKLASQHVWVNVPEGEGVRQDILLYAKKY